MSVKCNSCGALMFWAVTINGRRIPIDASPVDDGNIEIGVDESGDTTANVVGSQRGLFPAARYKSHFATCPNADDHRKVR